MDFEAVFTIKKEFDKEAFLRGLIIELGLKNETPVDVVDADFGEVKESVREAIVCTAQVEGDCTASIGYDRQEPYTDYETYREKVGDSYVTRQRAVTKYRTVTDWKVYQTQYSGKATRASYNSDEYGSDDSAIVTAIKSSNKDSIVEKGEAIVNSTGLARAIAACESHVEWSSVSFPGDRHRDVNFNSESSIQSLSCYKLPYYEVTYKYDGKDYAASCFACGDMNIYADIPPNDIDITSVVEEKTVDLEKKQKKSWVLFAISMIAVAVLSVALNFGWLFPIPILLLLKAKKDSENYRKEYQNYSDDLSKNVAESKVEALKAALERHNFEPISKNLSDSLEGKLVPGAKELKSIKKRIVWSWVLVVILSIISIFTINSAHQENLHSPKQLEINVVSKEVEYNPDVSGYMNGCYYIYYDYEIEAKKTGIDYIQFKLRIKDKSGNEIGFIKSSISDLNLDAGDEKVVTLSLQENQPEKDEFFTELYNADFKDYKYEIEIGSIQFTDGEYYHNDEYDQFE